MSCDICGKSGCCGSELLPKLETVGANIEWLNEQYKELEKERDKAKEALQSIADCSKDIAARLCARGALGLLEEIIE